MKKTFKLIGIIVLAAVIALTFAACSGRLSGTYHYDDEWYITFKSNGSYTGHNNRTGTYTVSGDEITLSPSFYGSTWTIVDKNTVEDRDGDEWRKR